MSERKISQAQMAARIAAGTAWPLMSEGVPGPVRLPGGAWWAVAPTDPGTGDEDYRLVSGPMAAWLDRRAHRLTSATNFG